MFKLASISLEQLSSTQWSILSALQVSSYARLPRIPLNNTALSPQTGTNNNPMNDMYIDARYNAVTQKLQIFATSRLIEYEQYEKAESIRLLVLLTCTGAPKRFIFEQPLNDANNHDPVFSQSLYEFNVMLPLPRGFDLSFFQEVSARDLDIRNNKVQFVSHDATGITVGTAQREGDDGKTFYAALVTTHQLLTVGEQLAFTITATVRYSDIRYHIHPMIGSLKIYMSFYLN